MIICLLLRREKMTSELDIYLRAKNNDLGARINSRAKHLTTAWNLGSN